MTANWRKTIFATTGLIGGCVALICGAAAAQSAGSPPVGSASAPIAQAPVSPPAPLSSVESVTLRQALDAARSGDLPGAAARRDSLTNPLARKLAQWAIIDANGSSVGFFDLDAARRDLWNWPRATRRQNAVEKSMESAKAS